LRFGISTTTADRFFAKAVRSRYTVHRQLADKLAQACPPNLHAQLIVNITDGSPDDLSIDLDDPIGIVNVGRDCTVSYAPRDNPRIADLDGLCARCWHLAIDAYPHFDNVSREALHDIVDQWQRDLLTAHGN
jgi:hypothetical protein